LDLFLSDIIPFTFALIGDRSLFLALGFGVGDFLRPMDLDLLLLTGLLVLDLFFIGVLVLRLLMGVLDLRLLIGDRFLERDRDLLPDRFLDKERFLERDLECFLDRDLERFLDRDLERLLDLDLERLLDRDLDRLFLDRDIDRLFLGRETDRLLDRDRFLDRDRDRDFDRFLDLDLDFETDFPTFFSAFFLSATGSTFASVPSVVGVAALVLSMTSLWSAGMARSEFLSMVTSVDSSPAYSVVKISSWFGNKESRTRSIAAASAVFS
jgi:hypothetical protein